MNVRSFTYTVVIAVSCSVAFAADPDPVEQNSFTYKSIDTKVTVSIDMSFCPAGNLGEVITVDIHGDSVSVPTEYESELVKMSGFWMAITELSQGDYDLIRSLGEEHQVELPTVKALRENIEWWEKDKKEFEGFIDGKKPVFGLSIQNCFAICNILQQSQEIKGESLFTTTWRIPTYHEWQYACRAVKDAKTKEFMHFNRWGDPSKIFTSKEDKKDYKTIIGKMGYMPDEVVDSSQAALIGTLLGSSDNKQKATVYLLSKLLGPPFNDPIGTVHAPRALKRLSAQLHYDADFLQAAMPTMKNARSNKWKLYHMHGNVAEWCIDHPRSATNPSPLVDWESMVRSPNDLSFRLAGGSFDKISVKPFTIWGASSVNYSEIKSQTRSESPGFRLLGTKNLVSGWLQIVRTPVIHTFNNGADTASILALTEAHRKELSGQFPSDRQETINGLLDLYISFLQEEDSDGIVKSLKPFGTSKAQATTNEYFDHLAKFMKPD